jgi:hypothetical protein
LNPAIAPNVGLLDNYAVLSLIPSDTERLMESRAVAAEGPLANVDRPLAAAVYCNFAGFITAVEPWVRYMAAQAMPAPMNVAAVAATQDPPPDEAAQFREIMDQVMTGLEIARCFKGVAAVTYIEGDVVITHAESRFEDLQ